MRASIVVVGLAAASATAACGGENEGVREEVAVPSSGAEPAAPEISREADAELREMSEYLASLQAFRVQTEGSVEVVLKDGQKLTFPFASDVRVRRPDRLRSDRTGEVTDLHFYYDGRTFTLYGENENLYAQAKAPPNLDDAIDAARTELDLEAPGADLLMSDVYATLTEAAQSGFVVGDAMIDGTPCKHLAFRGSEVDFQIWVEDGPEPLPRRYSITSKNDEGAPQFTVELSDWDTSVALPDEVFEFEPPPGAQKIEFLRRGEERKA